LLHLKPESLKKRPPFFKRAPFQTGATVVWEDLHETNLSLEVKDAGGRKMLTNRPRYCLWFNGCKLFIYLLCGQLAYFVGVADANFGFYVKQERQTMRFKVWKTDSCI